MIEPRVFPTIGPNELALYLKVIRLQIVHPRIAFSNNRGRRVPLVLHLLLRVKQCIDVGLSLFNELLMFEPLHLSISLLFLLLFVIAACPGTSGEI